MRMARCAPVLRLGEQSVVLPSHFHEAWIELAQRGRQGVLVAMGQHLCQRNPGVAVVASMTCEYLGGARRDFTSGDLCQGGAF